MLFKTEIYCNIIFFNVTFDNAPLPNTSMNLFSIFIYIRSVTVHKFHSSIRYDKVVSRFGMFSIRGGGGAIGYIAMLEIFLF